MLKRTKKPKTKGTAHAIFHCSSSLTLNTSHSAKTLKPTTIPRTMNPSLSAMSVPRMWAGEISPMYSGAACIEKPMPKPYVMRAKTTNSYTP